MKCRIASLVDNYFGDERSPAAAAAPPLVQAMPCKGFGRLLRGDKGKDEGGKVTVEE